MASVELVLAAVAAADLCLQYGKKLVGTYQDFKNADEYVRTRIVIVEAIWSKTTVQVGFVKRVAKTLEEEHCRIHLNVFEILKSKLMMATSKIESVMKKTSESGIKRWKLMFLRDSIDDTITQLEQWQRIFDPTWYLILRIGDKLIDTELLSTEEPETGRPSTAASSATTLVSAQKFRDTIKDDKWGGGSAHHVSLPDALDWDAAAEIKYSSTQLVQRAADRSERLYVVDTIVCHSNLDVYAARTDAESLAKKLSQVEPGTFGLLVCHGLIKRKNPETRHLVSMSLAFRPPTESKQHRQPASLRQHLMQGSSGPGCPFSLTRVLSIARQLAQAVSYIHTCDFVHKNIRPETVLVFPDAEEHRDGVEKPSTLGSAYLLGFDSFRSVNFGTLRSGDEAWERNLYRHPSRQGFQAQRDYIMQHDVYSLGVCLLELGLWESFVQYHRHDGGAEAVELAEDEDIRPSKGLGLELKDLEFTAEVPTSPLPSPSSGKIKEHLVGLARSKLPLRMGDKFTAVVVTCLTCLDEGNEDFGDQSEMCDDDGILIGVRFIEKVLFKLSEISF